MVEALRACQILSPDLTVAEIVRELHMLKSGELLRGFRGAPPFDVLEVAKMIARVGALLLAERSLQEIDLNPVIVYAVGAGAIALDALMIAS